MSATTIRSNIRAFLAIAVALGSHSMRVNAQHSTSNDAMNVVRTAFDAYEARRWSEFAALVHPDALAEFYKQRLEMAQAIEAHPMALHENEQRSGTSGDSGDPVLMQFAGVKTVKELRALTPQQSLARYLEARSPKENPRDPGYQPPIKTREIIGEVTEAPDLVHVVYRLHTDVGRYGRGESIEILSVKRRDGVWKLMLNNELALIGFMNMISTDSTED